MQRQDLLAVLGSPVAHSLSPAMHTAGFHALNLKDRYTYVAIEVQKSEVATFWDTLHFFPFVGFSITFPLKEVIAPLLGQVTPAAKAIAAVNTAYLSNGVWYGDNTDWMGVRGALESVKSLHKGRLLVLGAGGAARAAIYAGQSAGAEVLIANRTSAKGRALAKEFGARFVEQDELQAKDFTHVCNMTTVGMLGSEGSPLREDLLSAEHVVLDAVYKPRETALLKAAKRANAITLSGVTMLLHQGVAQFELFTGHKAPIEAMRQSLSE